MDAQQWPQALGRVSLDYNRSKFGLESLLLLFLFDSSTVTEIDIILTASFQGRVIGKEAIFTCDGMRVLLLSE